MPSRIYDSPLSSSDAFSCAALQTIAFDKLVQRDSKEIARLLAAGEKEGFFYLDISTPSSKGLYDDYQAVLDVMKEWFNEPLADKTKFAYGSDVQGYKPIGTQTGATENSKDGFETLRVAQQGFDWTDRPLPPRILKDHTLFNDFISKTRFHVLQLLASLSDAIGLEGEDRYERFHRDDLPSNSSMTFHRYPKRESRNVSNVGHNKHTDISSIAFLFAQQWGLQVPTVSGKGWDYVRPRPGHAICNVGDSLRFLSGFRLRSVLHRVVPVAEMEHSHRFSIAYFTRPVNGTVFKDSEGRVIKADEWFSHKFDIYRASHAEQRANTVLTGGIETEASRAIVHERLED